MRLLAEGYEYRVYGINTNRVLKELHPYHYRFRKFFELARKRDHVNVLSALLTSHQSVKKNKTALRTMMTRMKDMPPHLFANPTFLGNTLNYTQDRVTPLEVALPIYSLEDSTNVIEEYLELQKIFWSYGIHDAVYKFQPNYGIDTQNRIVCVDFGEFVFTLDDVLASVKEKQWLSRPSYKKWEDGALKRYYTKRMSETMTEESLKQCWAKK